MGTYINTEQIPYGHHYILCISHRNVRFALGNTAMTKQQISKLDRPWSAKMKFVDIQFFF